MQNEMQITYKPLDALREYENNPRNNENAVAAVAASIEKFGWKQPIVIDAAGVIIAGHTRAKAAAKLGLQSVPCVIADDLTEEQIRAYRLADNKTAELAGWDFDKLDAELEALAETGFDMEAFGFDALELDDPQEVVEDEPPEIDEDAEPRCKLGDIWQLGRHRLMCGDSTDPLNIKLLLQGQTADMVFTDPPYGIGIDGQKESVCNNPKHNRKAHEFMGWDNERPDKEIFDYILSLNVPTVIFGGNYFADWLPPSRGWVYWDKGQDGLTMSDGELAWTSLNKPLRRVVANRGQLHGSVHPTQKPVSVVSFCIKYAGDGKRVLDLFGGSGSTIIACEQIDRYCYMMELNPKYCDAIIQRWETLTGETAVLVNE